MKYFEGPPPNADLQRVRPIHGIFNPDEEVQKLWLIPKGQRREAVSAFKDKLARQREAWALCRTSIEEQIDFNPDLSREKMVGIIEEFASHYGFAENHVIVAESLVDDYLIMHRRINEVREKITDDIALINRLTGMEFTESDAKDFDVAVGPVSIEISCSGVNVGRIDKKSKDPVVGFMDGGFASTTGGSEPVYYIVVNNDHASSSPAFHATTVPHEREHLKNRILGPKLYGKDEVRTNIRQRLNRDVLGFLRHQVGERLLGFERNFGDEVFGRYTFARDPEEKALLLGEYMRLKRESALNSAKNEIIAMQAELSYHRYTYNIFSNQDGGSYDYLAYLRNFDKKKDDPLWQETSKRVLVCEYRDIIDDAITAFDQLRGSGYSQAETIAMLSDKRLADWPKTVRRLIEEKNNHL